ncbi:hypothetical protein FRB94_011384 [Tulasnella sp. JGI-2019a]|nr:hypothetical protein FRB94_011384 [Tulasnella sp. JGI-2019a]KAG9005260.1 hypothetical protein FRB93_009814 [Tulasnella sp. JGI-2019a]
MLVFLLSVFLSSLFSLALAIPVLDDALLQKRQQAFPEGTNGMVVNNNLGQAHGTLGVPTVARFVVKYATASRFGQPVLSTQWIGMTDPAAMPPSCPQAGLDPSQYSEDCLYAVIYAPVSAMATAQAAKVPVYVWFHGGSFVEGGASNPGLDGSNLAIATNSIVVVVQYRLGALGWLPPSYGPSPKGNLGLTDAIAALQFVNKVLPFFGGNTPVTIGGQSSGGQLVRALLASPSAASLFKATTLHADPMAYGFMKNNVYQELQTSFYSSVLTNCPNQANSFTCLSKVNVSSILSAQSNFLDNGIAHAVDPSVGTGSPIRPHAGDGGLIQSTLTTTYPSTKKPLFITSNRDDAGQVVGGFPDYLPISQFATVVQMQVGTTRAQPLTSSTFYDPSSSGLLQPYAANGDVARQALDRIGTDQMWRCAIWDMSRRLASKGWTAYVSTFEAGATYSGNEQNNYCTEAGVVCHEDEIFIIFGTTPSPTTAQTTLTTQIQSRLKAFFANPAVAPNPAGYATWKAATAANANAIQFGGSGDGQLTPVFACDPSFWGTSAVPYEWQVYGE